MHAFDDASTCSFPCPTAQHNVEQCSSQVLAKPFDQLYVGHMYQDIESKQRHIIMPLRCHHRCGYYHRVWKTLRIIWCISPQCSLQQTRHYTQFQKTITSTLVDGEYPAENVAARDDFSFQARSGLEGGGWWHRGAFGESDPWSLQESSNTTECASDDWGFSSELSRLDAMLRRSIHMLCELGEVLLCLLHGKPGLCDKTQEISETSECNTSPPARAGSKHSILEAGII